MKPRGAQLAIPEVTRTPTSAPPPLPPAPPAEPRARAPRHEQLLIATCDVCRKPLSYKGTGRPPVTCQNPDCQRERRRRRNAAAARSRSSHA